MTSFAETYRTESLAIIEAATDGEVTEDYFGITDTRESLEDFKDSARNHWNEARGRKEGTIGRFPYVSWHSMQTRKGERRHALSVVDAGDLRFVISDVDISIFA